MAKINANKNLEKGVRRTTLKCPIFDFGLHSEIFSTFNGIVHSGICEESSQVSGVRRTHDQREEPPHPANPSGRITSA